MRNKYYKKMLLRFLGFLLIIVFILGVTVLIYSCLAPRLPGPTEPTEEGATTFSIPPFDLLFGAATISLTLVAIILAIMSFYGWVSIADKVSNEVSIEISKRQRFDIALNRAGDGVIYGVISEFLLAGHDPYFFIDNSITYFRLALGELSGPGLDSLKGQVRDIKDLDWKVKNNLAYMLAVRGRREDADESVKLISEVRNAPGYEAFRAGVLLTEGWVAARYAAYTEMDPLRRLKDVREELRSYGEAAALTKYERTELRRTLDLLETAIRDKEAANSQDATIKAAIKCEAERAPTWREPNTGFLASLRQWLRRTVGRS